MRLYLLFCVLLVCQLPMYGQTAITTTQILGTAKHQSQFRLQERKLDFLKETPHNLPLINRWEFRTQTHDLDLSEQRFTFRVRPNSPKERSSQEQLYLSTIQYHQEATRQVLLDGLQKRYHTCLSLIISEEGKQIIKDLAEVYQALIEVAEASKNFNELLEAEEAKEVYTIQLFDYESGLERAFRQIAFYRNDKTAFELVTPNFISLEDIKERIVKMEKSNTMKHPSLSILANEINLIDKELLVERAKQKKWLSFAQLRYGGSDTWTPFRETFNVAFAFKLPVKGNGILKNNELTLDKIEAENKWGQKNYQLQKEHKNLMRDLLNLLEKYEQLNKNLIASQEKITRSFNVSNTNSYTELSLKLRPYLLKKKLRLHQLEEKIYRSYIDLLAVSGKMIELPLTNYLTTDLGRF